VNTFTDELRKIRKGERPQPLYWICCSNPYLEREFLELVASSVGGGAMSKVAVDLTETEINDFVFTVTSGSLLSGGKVIIVSGALKIKGDDGKRITDAITNANPSNIIVFTEPDIPKTTSLGKHLASKAIQITESGLTEKMLSAWVKKKFQEKNCQVTDDASSIMVERSMGDLVALSGEIEKIASWLGEGATATRKDIEQLVPENPEIIVFQVFDALGAKQTSKGIKLLHGLVRNGEPAERVMAMLYNHFMRVLVAKEMSSQRATEKQIAERLRCHPFAAKKALESAIQFKKDELVSYLSAIANADVAAKTGMADALSAIESALFQLAGN